MRAEFVRTMIELAAEDRRIFLLTADLGWNVLESFADRFPDRFLNVGVAEQNLVGIATGLAQAGFVPFIYSIANFVTMRCYEQIRNGPVLHRLPVRIIGVGGGYAYGHAGPTHHAFEDLAIMRCQPGLTVLAPADPEQARSALQAITDLPGPVYLRIGKGNNPAVMGLDGRFALGRPEVIRAGGRVLLLACGTIVVRVLAVAQQLTQAGLYPAVAVLAHLEHEPGAALVGLLARFPEVVTIEEGFRTGALASLVAEAVTQHGLDCRLLSHGVERLSFDFSGSPEFLLERAGLGVNHLTESCRHWLERRDLPAAARYSPHRAAVAIRPATLS